MQREVPKLVAYAVGCTKQHVNRFRANRKLMEAAQQVTQPVALFLANAAYAAGGH